MTDDYLQCNACGWYSKADDTDESVIESNECPDCGAELTTNEHA